MKDDQRLEGKVAIVTGAGSSGPGVDTGKAISVLFARVSIVSESGTHLRVVWAPELRVEYSAKRADVSQSKVGKSEAAEERSEQSFMAS